MTGPTDKSKTQKTAEPRSRYSVSHETSFLKKLFNRFGAANGLILDIGCGDGFFTDLLANMGYEACGVDFDAERIKTAHNRYTRSFALADSRRPPFPKNTFDIVFCRALSTFYTDLRLQSAKEQRDTLFDLLRVDGLFVYQTASDLSGRRTTIQNHEIDDVRAFFREQGHQVSVYFFFATTLVFRVLRNFAFSSTVTRLSITLTKITGHPGYIVCAGQERIVINHNRSPMVQVAKLKVAGSHD